jgi:hypothetical protein
MTEEIEFDKISVIDEARLHNYYDRIQNQFSSLTPIQIVARFLNSQSIGTSMNDVLRVLEYYQEKIDKENSILDFAFEWIRAHKIRFQYKKYLGSAQFPDYKLAIDGCIFLFFSKYDKLLRRLFKSEIKEYEISAIFNIFFNPNEKKYHEFNKIMDEQRNNVPTIFEGKNKIDISLITIRSGLSDIIEDDYNKIMIGTQIHKKTDKNP